MGSVYTEMAWADNKTLVLAYCQVDANASGVSDYDALLEALFNAGKKRADSYLNNPFEEINATIVFSGVVANDSIYLKFGDRSLTYTAQATGDEDNLYFAIGADDEETADNFCALVNSTTLGGSYGSVGLEGILAANVTGTVTLTRRYGYVGAISVESDSDTRLLVRQVRTDVTIPSEVTHWLCQFVKRHFDNRDALMQKNVSGRDVKMWVSMKAEESGMIDNFDLLAHLRIPVGLG